MTQEEFYLKAILAMASNPKYTEMINDEDDPNETFPVLQVDQIIEDAHLLLIGTQEAWKDAFEGKGLEDVHDQLAEIAERGISVDAHCLIEEA